MVLAVSHINLNFKKLENQKNWLVPRVGFGTAALGNKAGASIKAALDYGKLRCTLPKLEL